MNSSSLFLDLGWMAAWALVFALVFIALSRAVEILPLQPETRANFRRQRPLLALILAFIFCLYSAKTLFSEAPHVQNVALLLVVLAFLLAGLRPLRDYLAGVTIISEQSCRIGDQVRVGELVGRVTDLGPRGLALETPEGDRALLPYSRALAETIVVTRKVEGGTYAHSFSMKRPDSQLAAFMTGIERAALSHHHSALARLPEIEVLEQSIEVTIFALSKAHVLDIEGAIRSAVEKKA